MVSQVIMIWQIKTAGQKELDKFIECFYHSDQNECIFKIIVWHIVLFGSKSWPLILGGVL
jgi:hypothetical protein